MGFWVLPLGRLVALTYLTKRKYTMSQLDVIKINEDLEVSGLSKEEVGNLAVNMATEFNSLEADNMLNVYGEFIRLKHFIAEFEKNVKEELIKKAIELGLNKEKKAFAGVTMQIVSKKSYNYSECKSNHYETLVDEFEECKKAKAAYERQLKALKAPKKIHGEDVSAPTFESKDELKTTY